MVVKNYSSKYNELLLVSTQQNITILLSVIGLYGIIPVTLSQKSNPARKYRNLVQTTKYNYSFPLTMELQGSVLSCNKFHERKGVGNVSEFDYATSHQLLDLSPISFCFHSIFVDSAFLFHFWTKCLLHMLSSWELESTPCSSLLVSFSCSLPFALELISAKFMS